MSDAKRGTCQLCDWEGVLTKNGRMRSHKGDPEKGVLENGNCPKGSDLPREAVAEVPKTASGGPNPHRAPLAPDAPLGSPGVGCAVCACGGHHCFDCEKRVPHGSPEVCRDCQIAAGTYDPNCMNCGTDTHICPGCGANTDHATVTCADCTVFYADAPVPPYSKLEPPVNPEAAAQLQREDVAQTDSGADDGAEDFFGGDSPSDEDDAASFFDTDEPEQGPSKGRWITARYDGECDVCFAYFSEGDEIRGTEEGWQGRDCCGQREDDGEELEQIKASQAGRPQRVSPKPPLKNGRYNLPDPVTKVPSKYSRVTTWVKAASDHFSLKAWELRSAVVGMAKSPDLVARVVGLDVKADAKALNALADMAKDAAGAKDKANVGTKVHKWTEEVDSGRIGLDQVPEEFRERVGEYRAALAASGCEVLPHLIERTTVVLELGVVGTFDQVWKCPDGVYRIVDKKTGAIKYDRLEIEAQLSIYAHGANRYGVAEWDPELGEASEASSWVWRPLTDNDGNPIQVSETSGIVVHMPQDGSPIRLLEVDLTRGWEHAQLCKRVKESQRTTPEFPLLEFAGQPAPQPVQAASKPAPDAGSALLAQIAPQRISTDSAAPEQPSGEPSEPRVTWAERFAAVTCREEADAVLAAARDAGMPKERQTQLIAVARQALGLSAA